MGLPLAWIMYSETPSNLGGGGHPGDQRTLIRGAAMGERLSYIRREVSQHWPSTSKWWAGGHQEKQEGAYRPAEAPCSVIFQSTLDLFKSLAPQTVTSTHSCILPARPAGACNKRP